MLTYLESLKPGLQLKVKSFDFFYNLQPNIQKPRPMRKNNKALHTKYRQSPNLSESSESSSSDTEQIFEEIKSQQFSQTQYDHNSQHSLRDNQSDDLSDEPSDPASLNLPIQKQGSLDKIQQSFQLLEQIFPSLTMHEILRILAQEIGCQITIRNTYSAEKDLKVEQTFKINDKNIYHHDEKISRLKVATNPKNSDYSESDEKSQIDENSQDESEVKKNILIHFRQKYVKDQNYRQIQLSIVKFLIQFGEGSKSYNASCPMSLRVNFCHYRRHLVSIVSKIIHHIESYIHNETDKYLTKTTNSERIYLKKYCGKIKSNLKDITLRNTYILFMKRIYGLQLPQDPELDSEKVIKLYEWILTQLKSTPVILPKKHTNDVNFFQFRSSHMNYTFTNEEIKDLQLYTIKLRNARMIQNKMSQKYNWNNVWPIGSRRRRQSIINKLKNIIGVKMKQIQILSDQNEKTKYGARITSQFLRKILSPHPLLAHEDQNLKKFFTDLYNFPSIKLSRQQANNIIKFFERCRKKIEQIYFNKVEKRRKDSSQFQESSLNSDEQKSTKKNIIQYLPRR